MIKNNGCCDLKYAKRLEELGEKQESIWWWDLSNNTIVPFGIWGKDLSFYQKAASNGDIVSAFTVAELGEMLPQHFEKDNETYNLVIVEDVKAIIYEAEVCYNTFETLIKIEGDTEANARAKMLIWLIENKKIDSQ